MNIYDLSRNWFDWSFENPEKINPNHTALYFFIIEHCNRLGWKNKFGLPTTMAKEAIGIKSYNTYIKTLNDLIDFGFIKLIEKSKNQYSSNIVALSNFNKALDKALDKALIKHTTKHSESTQQSNDSINKQLYNIQINNITQDEKISYFRKFAHLKITNEENEKLIKLGYSQNEINRIYDKIENYKNNTKYKSLYLTAINWLEKEFPGRAKKEEPKKPKQENIYFTQFAKNQ